jgi:DNA-binding NtrC family response regulator
MSERARVLIADDEASIRFVLRETLESAGHDVVEVASGEAALQALAAQPFDIAFFDIRMPGPSGLELLDPVRALGSDVAVVIITAQSTFENAVEAMKRGALDYLVKPFGMDAVQALVAKVTRTRALERELRSLRREVGRRTVRATGWWAGVARCSRCSRLSDASPRATCRCSSPGRAAPGRSWSRARSTRPAPAPSSPSSR